MEYPVDLIVTAFVTGAVLFGAGVLVLWLARRGAQGKLSRNQFAGIRTKLTLGSDTAWYAAHRASAKQMAQAGYGTMVGGLVTVVAGVLALFQVTQPIVMTVMLTGTLGASVWLLSWVLAGSAVGQRAARQAVNEERGLL